MNQSRQPDSHDIHGAGLAEVDGRAAAEEDDEVGSDHLGRKSTRHFPESGPGTELGPPKDLFQLVQHHLGVDRRLRD